MSGDASWEFDIVVTDCTLDIMIMRRSLRNSLPSLNGSCDNLDCWSGLKRHGSYDYVESRKESGAISLSVSLESLMQPVSIPVVMRWYMFVVIIC